MFFILLFLAPYLIMHRKRYREARDRELYLKTNLLSSNLWIIFLVSVGLIFVNSSFQTSPTHEAEELIEITSPKKNAYLDSINFHRYSHMNIPEYQRDLILTHLSVNDEHQSLFSYYDSITSLGHQDIAYWGKAYILLELAEYDSALTFLDMTSQGYEGRYFFYTKAMAYAGLDQEDLAIDLLFRELELKEGAHEHAANWLINYHFQRDNYEALSELLSKENAFDYFPLDIRREVQLLDFNISGYYGTIFTFFVQDINPIGILAAFLILMVWFRFVTQLAFFQQLRSKELIACLVLGMGFAFLTFLLSDLLRQWSGDSEFWNTFTWSVIGIGAIEELVKIIPLLIIMVVIKRKLEAYEYILFASISALGFGFSENLLYFDGTYGNIITGRALTAAVGHMIDSSIFAYGFVLANFKYKNLNNIVAFFIFWGLAALVHGLYDYWIFAELYLFFFFFLLLIIRVWNTVLNNSLNNSKGFTYSSNFNTKRLQFYLAISLSVIIMFEYIVTGAQLGRDEANSFLISAFFSGAFLIAFLGSKLSSLNLIKDYWGKINYSINPFTDDIVTQNFVHQKVQLGTYYSDQGLVEYFPAGVLGKITSRVVLQNRAPTFFMSNDDSGWFLVKLAKPLDEPGFRKDRVLIQFKDHYSSLNDQRKFIVKLLLIPEKITKIAGYPARKDFESLGWVFLESANPHTLDATRPSTHPQD
ncbi:MAG: PrsW family glutamic-type intramembrane protease [Cytophagales bacterium]|nr:PrsW family glutamic-type intramembrane protease [Cytophagales bacterium]